MVFFWVAAGLAGSALGLVVAILSVTGDYLWLKKRRAEHFRRNAELKITAERVVHL